MKRNKLYEVSILGGGGLRPHSQQNNQLKQKGDNILSNVLMVINRYLKNTYRWGGGKLFI